jgi:hypothetical protein
MAITQAHIDALNEAIASGVRSVTIGGDTTIYNTTDSLIRARDDMVAQLAAQDAAAAERRPIRRVLAFFAGRGY